MKIRLAGLPRGERGRLTIVGPLQSPASRRLSRRLSPSAVGKLRLPHGAYKVRVSPVNLRRAHGTIRPGAVASPVKRRLRVRVLAGGMAKLTVRYGTIVNPGVRSVAGQIVKVFGRQAPSGAPGAGPDSTPSRVIVKGGKQLRRGDVLSAPPSGRLPKGLLGRVGSVRHWHGKQVVGLTPVGIYEVAPNMSFDIPLSSIEGASLSKLIQCKIDEIKPEAHVSDFHLSGGWTTTHVLFANVTSGATVELHFRVSAGVGVTTREGRSCSVPLPAIGFQGMAGPIPVYGGFRPTVSAQIGAAASMHAGGSVEVTSGVKIGGFPPTPTPIVRFGSPRFEFNADLFVGLKASVGLSAEVGIGAENAANIHADLGNSLDFVASPGHCSWDLNLGSFSATGEVGRFSISTPSTPALYHHNIWQAACGATPVPQQPPPSPTLPQTRATMGWDTDSDIDLYAWDEAGNLAYWLNREGVPQAELVEDIIPSEGEFEHSPEVFREVGSPNRRYTFGICDFHGEGADVTLTVVDPGGGARTYQSTLFGPGDSAVITQSPLGGGYVPPPEWCQYVE